MKMNDMMVVSVDDHISEPPDMFDKHLSGEALATAPKMRTTATGTNYWEYQGMKMPSVGLNAVVGRVPEEYGMEPTSLDQMRKGVYQVRCPHRRHERQRHRGLARISRSCVGFDGGVFHKVPDKAKALVHLRAYNDWHIDEWCGAHPGRFIPCALLPTWDMEAMVEEMKRIAAKGCTAVSLNENPDRAEVCRASTTPIGSRCGRRSSRTTSSCACTSAPAIPPRMPRWRRRSRRGSSTMPISIVVGAADWLHLEALERYPTMRIALSEGGIGWIPYFLERADFSHERHKAWTHSRFEGTKPSEVFRKHFLTCFIDDAFGLQNLRAHRRGHGRLRMRLSAFGLALAESARNAVGERQAPDRRSRSTRSRIATRCASSASIRSSITSAQELTVGALRKKAAGVDVSVHSYGGAAPFLPGEKLRPITSGDVMEMYNRHRKTA